MSNSNIYVQRRSKTGNVRQARVGPNYKKNISERLSFQHNC